MNNQLKVSDKEVLESCQLTKVVVWQPSDINEAMTHLADLLRIGDLANVERYADSLEKLALSRNDRSLFTLVRLARSFSLWVWGTP